MDRLTQYKQLHNPLTPSANSNVTSLGRNSALVAGQARRRQEALERQRQVRL